MVFGYNKKKEIELKNPESSRDKSQPLSGAGVVQIAIWKDNPEVVRNQDIFTTYSQEIFYDFAKPLRLLDQPGWSPMIRAGSDEGFFVFSTDEVEF